MAMWRCPHCGTPQAETSRCWVCRRSSTSCGTCRNFRRAIAGQLGYCGLDRRRSPLRGDEMRGCWEAASDDAAAAGVTHAAAERLTSPGREPSQTRRLEFVPVGVAATAVTAGRKDNGGAAQETTTPRAADSLLVLWADEA